MTVIIVSSMQIITADAFEFPGRGSVLGLLDFVGKLVFRALSINYQHFGEATSLGQS